MNLPNLNQLSVIREPDLHSYTLGVLNLARIAITAPVLKRLCVENVTLVWAPNDLSQFARLTHLSVSLKQDTAFFSRP